MKKLYLKFYTATGKFILGKYSKLFSDLTLLIASSYLMVKKAFDFSISGWLLNNALHQNGVNLYLYVSGAALIIAAAIKLLSILFESFPPSKHSIVEPEEISDCLQSMNQEILGHITKCNDGPANVKQLSEQHSFEVNLRLITEALAEHIRKSVDTIKVKRKDLFISVYRYDERDNSLVYELHYDHKRDLVKSKLIDLSSEKYKGYESVKCFLSENSTSYVHDKRAYTKGSSKRYKTIQHYLGCKLETNGHVVGFLNIEFHNGAVFTDEEAMQDFMEENIFPFKLLLEYQYLKHHFFNKFSNFEENWRVA
ncbi:MAG: hypothetical protein ABJE79_08960 [Marinomonas sp.]